MLKALYLEFLLPIDSETFHFLSQSHFVDVISVVFKNAKHTYKQVAIVAASAISSPGCVPQKAADNQCYYTATRHKLRIEDKFILENSSNHCKVITAANHFSYFYTTGK